MPQKYNFKAFIFLWVIFEIKQNVTIILKNVNLIILWFIIQQINKQMSSIGKSSNSLQTKSRTRIFRNPLKSRVNDFMKDDAKFQRLNPFSQQLTPWNNSAKLQTSINLLKQQNQKKQININDNRHNHQVSVQHIVSHDNSQYNNLLFVHKNNNVNTLNQKQMNKYLYPKLKINSQQVIVSKNNVQQCKRFIFRKKSYNQDRNIKKIANLTMQWDQDIVYNPQKKYFEQQYLKRKILSQFPHTRNQNNAEGSHKLFKNQNKTFKLQFKNNKIHRKQVSIFQFNKKKQNSIQLQKYSLQLMGEEHKQKEQDLSEFLCINRTKNNNNQSHQLRVIEKKFQNQLESTTYRTISPQKTSANTKGNPRAERCKFRTSLKTRGTISPEKEAQNTSRNLSKAKRQNIIKIDIKNDKQKQLLNKITLQLNREFSNNNQPYLQIFTKTSPHFFQKKSIAGHQ